MTSHLTLVPKNLSPQSPAPVALHRSIVFTDIVDSTALVERLGDDGLLGVIVHHHQLAVDLGSELGASQVASTGDGVFAAFADADNALEFARRMVAGMRAAGACGACPTVRLHVGLATGPVRHWNGDLFGRTMHRAARICQAARPNEILLDADTADGVVDGRELLDHRRQVELRGFADCETIHQLAPQTQPERTRIAAVG